MNPSAPADDTLTCPLCTYNLTGLTEPRCPECGYTFDWQQLADARRNRHPFLFEHHPRRNLGAFLQTAVAGLRPVKFWTTLHPSHRIVVRRLLLYWAFVSLLALFPALIVAGFTITKWSAQVVAHRAVIAAALTTASVPPADITSALDQWLPSPSSSDFLPNWFAHQGDVSALLGVAFTAILWPWLTLLILLVFQDSLRLANLRAGHILRCVTYSADGVLWLAIIACFIVTFTAVRWFAATPIAPPPPPLTITRTVAGPILAPRPLVRDGQIVPQPPLPQTIFRMPHFLLTANLALACLIAWNAIRVAIAYRRYLRFRWFTFSVVASQLILLLLLMMAAAWIDTPLTNYWGDHLGLPGVHARDP